MPRPVLSGLILASLAVPAVALGQLVADVADGSSRLCVYGGARSNRFDDPANRVHRIARWEACPPAPPTLVLDSPPPATAMLTSETVAGQMRVCIYQQVEMQWRRAVPLTARCPLSAGMLPQPGARTRRYRD